MKKKIIGILLFLISVTPLYSPVQLLQADFYPVKGPCNLTFPEDHGSHPGYRLEWWYYTGNVSSNENRHFGFQLTFFRYQLNPLNDVAGQSPEAINSPPHQQNRGLSLIDRKTSAWRADQLYFAHAALSDLEGNQHLHADDTARGVLEIAGVNSENNTTVIFLKNWSVVMGPQGHHLKADAADFSMDLKLTPRKPPVMHGETGYTLKGTSHEQASCYYSFTRLETNGTIKLKNAAYQVRGFSWMDHEFSSEPLDQNAAGWDWFSLQMDDGSELMLYIIRMKDGTSNPASSGTFVLPDGTAFHLVKNDFDVDVLECWESPHTGGVYPSKWYVDINPLNTSLTISPNLSDQEMQSPGSTGITYWEGSVSIQGKSSARPVKGRGYVEMTGYADGNKGAQYAP